VILNPFPFLFAKPIHCPSIGQMHDKRTRKDYEQTTSRDSAQKACYERNASKRLPDDDQPCDEFGNFLEGQLLKRFLDSPTAAPSKEFLHSIGQDSYSSDDSNESVDVVRVCLQQCFDHVIQNLSPGSARPQRRSDHRSHTSFLGASEECAKSTIQQRDGHGCLRPL
jgi:hypothetical protein